MSHADPALAARLATGWFITVDPGTQYPAVAIFNRGALTHASRVQVPTAKLRALEEGERVRQIVRLIYEHVLWNAMSLVTSAPLAVVHEWPKHLSYGKGSKNSADQLFPLAAIGAGVAIKFDVEAISPIPSRWVGQVPKDEDNPDPWASPRGQLIWNRLRPEERPFVVPSHDAVDAAGIGLHVLLRLGRF